MTLEKMGFNEAHNGATHFHSLDSSFFVLSKLF